MNSAPRNPALMAAVAAASLIVVGCLVAPAAPEVEPVAAIPALVQLSKASNAALMRGDLDAYRSLVSYTDDFTLMSPFGGPPSLAAEYTPERMEAMARFFRNGVFEQEVVEAYGSHDMVVLALIERQRIEVGGLPAQDWPLRVTLVYRREGDAWKLAHRHADPLVAGVSLKTAAALAHGDIR